MIEVLGRFMEIVERIKNMEELSAVAVGVFGVILFFGIMNCILGYRLLRFWMMLGGFLAGAGIGFFAASTFEITDKVVYAGIMIATGLALGIIAFLVYKVGVFVMGAGTGFSLSIYILHPTTSSVFFLCVLIGVGLGTMAVRYSREVIIVSTSLMGGVMSGFSLAKLGGMQEFPYGALMSVGFAILGMLIQFAMNKLPYDEEEEEEVPGKSYKREDMIQEDKRSRDIDYYEETEKGLEDYLDEFVDPYEYEKTQKYTVQRNKKRSTTVKR